MRQTRIEAIAFGVIIGCVMWLSLVFTRGQPLTSSDVWESFFILLASTFSSVFIIIKTRQIKKSDSDQSQHTKE